MLCSIPVTGTLSAEILMALGKAQIEIRINSVCASTRLAPYRLYQLLFGTMSRGYMLTRRLQRTGIKRGNRGWADKIPVILLRRNMYKKLIKMKKISNLSSFSPLETPHTHQNQQNTAEMMILQELG